MRSSPPLTTSSYRLRFDTGTPPRYERLFDATIVFVVVSALVVFTLFRLELKQWRYTSSRDYLGIGQAVVVNTLVLAGFVAATHPVTVTLGHAARSRSRCRPGVMALFFLLTLVLVGGARFAARIVYERPVRGFRARADARRVLIVGAGEGGRLVCASCCATRSSASRPSASSTTTRSSAASASTASRCSGRPTSSGASSTRPSPTRSPSPSRRRRARCARASCARRASAGSRCARCRPSSSCCRPARARSCARCARCRSRTSSGREPVRMELDRVGGYLGGEVVMITGAGGSIGAELCRQIARVAPRRLILVDHAEENLFRIQRELEDDRHVHPSTLAPVLADCKEGERMREVFAEHRPGVVFHAAAYKHVGLMERNPVEAVRNNALATRLVARVAGESGVKRFVLVSTDKAVQPATVMGASKALAEFAVEAAQQRWPETKFATVRFGNVLGSSGSVVPIFRRQIALGGPVTVTDERMTRYFMTIPEAVQLVIRAGSLGEGGELFVLQMGEAVSIMQLARDMIELSGLAPGRDIAIEVVGTGRARSCTRTCSTPSSAPSRPRLRRSRSRVAMRSIPPRSRRCSTRSRCSCSRAMRPAWRPRSASSRPPVRRPRRRVRRQPYGSSPSITPS